MTQGHPSMNVDEVLQRQRDSWDKSSDGWRTYEDVVATMLEPTRVAMLERLRPRETTHHLDVATGTGEPGLSVAAVAVNGRVVLSDFADGMLAGVRATVDARGLAHVEVVQADAASMPFDDATFDSVSCRFGFMFFPDEASAAREIARVLRPGGVVCAAVWAEPEHNPWAVIPQRELERFVEVPAQPPGAPGVFRCSPPGYLASVLATAGLVVEHDEGVAITVSIAPAERFWDYTASVAAPVAAGLTLTDEEGRELIRTATLDAVQPYVTDGVLAIPGLARIVTARRP